MGRLGIIGPPDLTREMVELAREFPELIPVPLSYQNETEALSLVESYKDKVDVLVFTGPVPYFLAKNKISKEVRSIYVRYTGAALYRTLFYILHLSGGNIGVLLRLSIDTIPKVAVEETYTELGLNAEEVLVYEGDMPFKASELVKFHTECYNSGQSSAAVSCLTSAYEQLVEMGIPAYRIRPTRADMREALRLARMEVSAIHQQKAQIAVGIIKIETFPEKEQFNHHSIQRLFLDVYQFLLDYGEKSGVSVTFPGRDEFIFYGTRGAIQKITFGFQQAPLVGEIYDRFGIVSSLGIGIGRSVPEAEEFARMALEQCKLKQGSCYVIFDDGEVKGPLNVPNSLQYTLRSIDPQLILLAETAGISISTLTRLQAVVEKYGRPTITANEVANSLGITLRSARRLLNTMVSANLANVIGEEQPVGRGRPRQVYQLRVPLGGAV